MFFGFINLLATFLELQYFGLELKKLKHDIGDLIQEVVQEAPRILIYMLDKYLFFPSDDRYHRGRDVCQFTKIESGFEMKSWYTCGYWFIQISVFRYIGNIGVFHKDPVCSFHFRLEAVLARVEDEEGMKFTRRT